jgi:hypothetical protein
MEGVNLFANYAWYFAVPVLIVIGVFLLLRPHVKHQHLIPRKKIAIVGTMSILAGFIAFNGVLALTDPANIKDAKRSGDIALHQDKDEQKTTSAKPVVTNETKTEPIPYAMIERTDGTMVKGQNYVLTKGADGMRTIVYEVTRVGDEETARKEVKSIVTITPINQVSVVGTFIPKVAVADESPKKTTSTASAPKPSSVPAGAVAKCKDGTYSFTKIRTCRNHGGVSRWL